MAHKLKAKKRRQSESTEENSAVENHFMDLMEGCYYDHIDPHDCIPFAMTRPISNSGVLRLMSLFDGAFDGENINGGGICSGSDTPIVVKLNGTLLVHAGEYFQKKGFSEEQVKERLESRKVWYGIVDGEHSHNAITRLIESKSKWSGYKWFVTIIRSGFNIEKYRQLARAQNERHGNQFHVELTFFDMLSNMRTEYDKLCKVQKRVIGQDVVNAYCGYSVTSKKNSTLVQTANTVMRLPVSVITTIGEVSNSEHPNLILSSSKLNRRSVTSTDDVMRQEDCRVFRHFLHITSLKSCKSFMNAKNQNGERAQNYAIYRCQDLYKQRCFSKAVQPEELGRQYELALYSIEEEEKFLKYIRPDKWPEEMQNIRQNLLKTVQLSDEVALNRGNKDVLPCLSSAYRRYLPTKFIVKQQRLESESQSNNPLQDEGATQNDDGKGEVSHSNSENTEPPPPTTDICSTTMPTECTEIDKKGLSADDKIGDPQAKKLQSIKDKGINCHNMKWQEFLAEVWSAKDKQIDAIITEPPPSPSLSFIENSSVRREVPNSSNEELTAVDIVQIVKDGKIFLKPGGYFIVLIQFEMFQEWYKSFKLNGFNVMTRPLTFSYKHDSLPRRPSQEDDFPYGLEEYCIVARLPGSHPDGFNPNFNSNFNLIECNWSRRASIITNVELPKNKLCYPKTRKPVRVSEKPINLLAEIIDLFVPPYGTTMDLFAGSMTLPIASLKTSRRCIAIESEKKCFELSMDRLASLCNPVFRFVVNKESALKLKTLSSRTNGESSSTEVGLSNSPKSDKSTNASMKKASDNPIKEFMEDTSMDVDDIVNSSPKPSPSPYKNPSKSLETRIEPLQKRIKKTNDLEAVNTLLLLNNEG